METLKNPNEHDVSSRLIHSLQTDNERLRIGLEELLKLLDQQHNDNLQRIHGLLGSSWKSGEISNQETPDLSNLQGRTSRTLSPAVPGKVFFATRGIGDVILSGSLIMEKVSKDQPQDASGSDCSRSLPFYRNHRVSVSSSKSRAMDMGETNTLKLSNFDTKGMVQELPVIPKSFSLPMSEKCDDRKRTELASAKSTGAISKINRSTRVAKLASYLGKEGRKLTSSQREKWLLNAARTNDLHMAQFIIKQGTDVNVRDFHSEKTPLIIAAENNSIDVARLLVSSMANLELVGKEYGSTALLWAAWKNNYEMVQMLLEVKSDIGATNKFGSTGMSIATDKEVLALLNDNHRIRVERQENNVGTIPSINGHFPSKHNIEGRPSRDFISSNLKQQELQGKVNRSQLEVCMNKELILHSPAQDHHPSSNYIADDCKVASVAEVPALKISGRKSGKKEFGDNLKGFQQDDSNSQRQSLPTTDLPISVIPTYFVQDQDKDCYMEIIAENRSESSWDGYSSE